MNDKKLYIYIYLRLYFTFWFFHDAQWIPWYFFVVFICMYSIHVCVWERPISPTPIQRKCANQMRDLKRHTTSTSTIFSNLLTNVSIAAPPQNNGKVWRRMEKVKCGPCEMKLWKRVGSHHFSWRSGQHQHVVTAIQLPYDLSFAWCHDCHCDAFAALLHGPMIKWLGSSTCITVRCFLGVLSFKHPFSGMIIMTGTLNMFIYVHICSWKKLGRNLTALLVQFISSSHLKFAILTEVATHHT